MKKTCSFLLVVLALVCLPVQAQTARIFSLSADEWAQPRSGQVVASFSSVRNATEYWQKMLNAVILIRYPGEDSGELWASELKDWLVSLGIPNDYIYMRSGLDTLDEIEIVVAKKDELNF